MYFLHTKVQKRVNGIKVRQMPFIQNLSFLESFKPENVLILSGDHIYKMHYGEMLKAHKESGAAVTIAVMPVPWEEASRFGIMNVDERG